MSVRVPQLYLSRQSTCVFRGDGRFVSHRHEDCVPKNVHRAVRICDWCMHIGASFNGPIFIPKSGCFSGMSLVGRASTAGLLRTADLLWFVHSYCTSLPVQTRVLLIHSILPLPLSRPSFPAVETKVCVGMGSSWDAASVCSQVSALKQCRVPQFMQTLGCEVSWGHLSHLELLAHAGPHTATVLLSVVPEPVRWHPSQLCHPGCSYTPAVYLSWSSVQGVLWQIHFVLQFGNNIYVFKNYDAHVFSPFL